MQKVKTSDLPLMAVLTALLLGVALSSHVTDAVAQADESASRIDQSATLGDMIKLAKQAGEREFAARLNPASKNPPKDAPAEPVVERNPVLLALYGIDRNYKAELDVNGQSRVVPVPGPLRQMGPWKYITLMEEGVLLTKGPQDSIKAGSTRYGAAVQACQQQETCLFLSVPKGSDDSRSQVTADAQARHLAGQLPGRGRAPALEFGGKPQNPGDRSNMGNTAPALR
ncbi:hypothetical protein [Herbaspirillum frisingense]|uniref:hypothetical protein n=1 Tax=Herbaspirillum frisingense TaxID=92645 RepID=UPI001F327B0F|nr:hypothetical protein [Herbaspirillum frisingense]UIN19847.1 hypothetical protein LAZ82_15265 [Herbaspirillum frisingense]